MHLLTWGREKRRKIMKICIVAWFDWDFNSYWELFHLKFVGWPDLVDFCRILAFLRNLNFNVFWKFKFLLCVSKIFSQIHLVTPEIPLSIIPCIKRWLFSISIQHSALNMKNSWVQWDGRVDGIFLKIFSSSETRLELYA